MAPYTNRKEKRRLKNRERDEEECFGPGDINGLRGGSHGKIFAPPPPLTGSLQTNGTIIHGVAVPNTNKLRGGGGDDLFGPRGSYVPSGGGGGGGWRKSLRDISPGRHRLVRGSLLPWDSGDTYRS